MFPTANELVKPAELPCQSDYSPGDFTRGGSRAKDFIVLYLDGLAPNLSLKTFAKRELLLNPTASAMNSTDRGIGSRSRAASRRIVLMNSWVDCPVSACSLRLRCIRLMATLSAAT